MIGLGGLLVGKGAGRALRSSSRPNGLHSCHAMQSVCDSAPCEGLKVIACPDGTERKGGTRHWGVEVQCSTPP